MSIDNDENLKKNTYKKRIMQILNAKRLEEQNKNSKNSNKTEYTEEEKKNILQSINDKRLEKNLYEEMYKKRVENKRIYTYGTRKFYKFLYMDRGYMIEVSDLLKIKSKPMELELYYKNFEELKKKKFLIKIEPYSPRIFISPDLIRVYFKGYSLEDEI
ncbi:hypothetical protein MNB_SV-5-1242 [hydrothermal vent metagenome]|uniref:Uncharacterized protein n=1 Tax=hydrothermal vent metagenome TaxID=652676 RepID=A0A1W1EDL8_9ZZZZ